MVYGSVRDHGGIIDLSSTEGEGTTFRIYLPAGKEIQKIIPEKSGRIIQGSGRVLIAEDEPVLRDLMEEILADLGYTVLAVADGVEAVRVFRERSNELDIVMLDMIMPGMNGRDVMIECMKIKPGLRVIMCSGYSMNRFIDRLPLISAFYSQ